MPKRRWCYSLIAIIFLLPACGGGIEREETREDPTAKGEEATPALSGCAEAGLATLCDPIALTGCDEGQCYLTKGVGTSCVCTPGAIKLGEACSTSVECEPSTVCAGKVAPGICRQVCTPGECPAAMKCTIITGLEPFGYCEPE